MPSTIDITDLTQQLARRFETLGQPTQNGIVTLLQKLVVRGFGAKPILEAMRAANAYKDKWFHGPQGRDQRIDRFTWITTDNNSLIGNNMTVEEALMILLETGHCGWRDEC